MIRTSYITINFTKAFKSSNVSNNINNDLKKKDISFKELFYKKMNYDELHNNNSESTRMSYEENVRHHIFPIIGEKSIYELNVNDFDQIILHLKLYKIKKDADINPLDFCNLAGAYLGLVYLIMYIFFENLQ